MDLKYYKTKDEELLTQVKSRLLACIMYYIINCVDTFLFTLFVIVKLNNIEILFKIIFVFYLIKR